MEKRNVLKVAMVMACIVVLFLSACSSKKVENTNTGPTVYLSNAQKNGNSLRIDIYGRDLKGVAGVQLSFKYDPSVLSYTNSEEGSFLKQGGATTLFFDIAAANAQSGITNDFVVVKQGEGNDGDGLLGSINFNVAGKGKTRVDFNQVLIADKQSNKLNVAAEGLDVTV